MSIPRTLTETRGRVIAILLIIPTKKVEVEKKFTLGRYAWDSIHWELKWNLKTSHIG